MRRNCGWHGFRLWRVALALQALALRGEQVVISEIMYHPPGTLPEYLEVYNNSATPLDMAEWRLRDGVDYDFPGFASGNPGLTLLKPFERIVLCGVDAAVLRSSLAPTVITL